MKLPVIKHLQRNNEVNKLESTIDVLESFTEHRSVSEEEMDVIGELLTNLCGAVEVHKMIEDGTPERDAANNFVKKVLGSIDK
ncbi:MULTISPECIES: DUF6952 family protein [unclassified Christiangramia]|jgi:hypothetical protein|uniref:DUF6952 family protein n=1 Tax=unclassified Christiangramia TaxID=2615027 RepID=UPI0011514B1E|nr:MULTISPECIES: hypothetical protein [unclassified Christiangramia]TQI70281.1 hypothetical protein JM79_1191 [Gramella sp. Hel_I_59]WPY99579.1 hypothetical protein T8I65_05080 [Christiangramia sp. OXR-203]|tara:strand:+ start:231 stop:479 length:249 start_codon:yes stop_codon:yes gene_type:complete